MLIYIRSDLVFNCLHDLDHKDLEATWLKLLLPKSKSILCGVIYRPPKQSDLYSVLDSVCSSSSHFNEYETILLGDFNTDVSTNSRTNTLVSAFNSFIEMFNFSQLIHDSTRICDTTSITIDLI